ncbi:hypothetical protein [Kaistia granuli]|uniref:hypothetical protein n=1 Tax=Kaistia granuli TaxID=363259 RepID=UPI0003795D81|nr:hypothetical protein [Kaistia granuli]
MADQSNEMVGRAARALLIADGLEPECWPYRAEKYLKLARAAIEAMREPTERMVSEMQDTIRFISDEWFPADGVKTAWSDGIDAALSHDEVKA